MRIIFLGSDNYSRIVLEALKKDKSLEILKVISDKKGLEELKKISPQPEVGILASFGHILPPEILDLPQKGILNIHPSLLPKYRGPSPCQLAILNGEKKTGVTIIKLDEKVDHGPVATQSEEEIKPDDTAESLYQRLFALGARTLLAILPAFTANKIELREQDHVQATYSQMLTREDGRLDLSKPDDFKERFIRAMFPWPGAWTLLRIGSSGQAKRLKILKAHLESGKLILDEVQLEGKNPVRWQQFQEGYPGAKFS